MGTTELELSHEKIKYYQANAINNTYYTTNMIEHELTSSFMFHPFKNDNLLNYPSNPST